MLNTFVVESCEMDGIAKVPWTPKIVFPFKIFPATQSVTADERIETVPPLVYPLGIVTVPDLVEIVPSVEPLFAIDPSTEPLDPYPFFPVNTSLAEISPSDVSKNFAVPPPLLGMSTSGQLAYVTPLITTDTCAMFSPNLLSMCFHSK